MNSAQFNSSILSIALVSVKIEAELADQIADAVSQMAWATNRADCDGYISGEKRPPFNQQIKSAHGCIGVIDFDDDIEQALESAHYLQQLYPAKIALIARSTSQDPDVLLRAMRAGCTEFIGAEFDETTFADTLNRIFRLWSAVPLKPTSHGTVIAFCGVKGGVGTTTLAVHLAAYLAQCHNKKVLLIDNHPQLGHVCVYLGLDGSRYHFHELVRNINRLDSVLLRGYIATHKSGLDVLSSPDTCSNANMTDPEAFAQTLDFLRGEYDYVLLDCSMAHDETNNTAIDCSNYVYLVATPEIGSIRDLSRYVDNLSQTTQIGEKMHVVINRFSSQHAVNTEQIEKAIRLPVALKLPNSYAELIKSSILGEPISPKIKSDFGSLIVKWTDTIVGSSAKVEVEAPKKSIFSLWK